METIARLNVKDRRKLHVACPFRKITLHKIYLCSFPKISFKTDVHNVNVGREDIFEYYLSCE